MIFPFASLLAIASVVSAVPFKRFDNGTVEVASSESADSIVTIDKYITITLASSTMTLPETASSAISAARLAASSEDAAVTGTVNGQASVSQVSSSYPKETAGNEAQVTASSEETVTSTITSVVTVTNDNGIETEVPASWADQYDACEASTVTVTVTDGKTVSAVVNTVTSSVPVTAEFTHSDITTTLTQWVAVTVEQTSLTTSSSSTIAPSFTSYANGTADFYGNRRRNLLYAL